MNVSDLLTQLETAAETVEFDQVIAVINAHYHYTPSRFTNGAQVNEAGTNEGSCRIFAFGQLHNLTQSQTLSCFGKFYRDEVLGDPEGQGHGNIRQFMQQGWAGVAFDNAVLSAK